MGQYDIFISHAGEDKEEIARPLAEFLRRFGVCVWYDEYTLEIGDSLSESIDGGLAESRFGVVILSKAFFAKPWARRELEGLVAKEVAVGKTILPIWHGVGVEAVREANPVLANRLALSTERDMVEVIGLRIIKVVRKDVFDHIQRWVLFNEKVRQARPALRYLRDLKPSAQRHGTLPDGLVVRVRLVHQILGGIMGKNLDEMIDLFRRDLRPQREVEIWERIAAAYQEVLENLSPSEKEKGVVFKSLLALSFGSEDCVRETIAGDSALDSAILEAWKRLIPQHPSSP